MGDVESIKSFAFKAHAEQKYGDKPYSDHLTAVDNIVRKFEKEFSQSEFNLLIRCSWLHDIIEDTSVSKNELETLFGGEVAEIIYKVSDEPGKNRKERKAKTYPKIASNDIAIALKLADRIANVENCIKHKSQLFSMYLKEHAEFKTQLSNGRFSSMWEHLDNLMSTNKADK